MQTSGVAIRAARAKPSVIVCLAVSTSADTNRELRLRLHQVQRNSGQRLGVRAADIG